MLTMNSNNTTYATKRRRRNGKNMKTQQMDSNSKSNPSKRHRLRLNAELDTLASLLPYEQTILSKLDRLSILRLGVAYLRTKSFFQLSMTIFCNQEDSNNSAMMVDDKYQRDGVLAYDKSLSGDTFLHALNGFLFILDCNGEVFFSTHNIENYLGFHQSDIVHQSVFELVHSEDRDDLQRQFRWNTYLPADRSNMTIEEALQPENYHLLERSFTVRFRCLLDNTSGFLRLDIRGRIKPLVGQGPKKDLTNLGLFAMCTPFGPPSIMEMPHKELMYKSKHKLDMTLISIDHRGRNLLGYDEEKMQNVSGYALVHHDDLAYVASAHQELLKTGASGLIAYRQQTRDFGYQWLQTSSRLVYKNSKPDFIISTHRPLIEEEGRDLLGKRTMDFKVSYLDPGLTSHYVCEQTSSSNMSASTKTTTSTTSTRATRRYKSHLRDFLDTCRTKRKSETEYTPNSVLSAYGTPQYVAGAVNYNPDSNIASFVGYPTVDALYNQSESQNPLQNLHQSSTYGQSFESRFLSPNDSLYYRQLSNYYSSTGEYTYNHLMEVNRPTYISYDHEPIGINRNDYVNALTDPSKYTVERNSYLSATRPNSNYMEAYQGPLIEQNTSLPLQSISDTAYSVEAIKKANQISESHKNNTSPTNHLVQNPPTNRQSVLIWNHTPDQLVNANESVESAVDTSMYTQQYRGDEQQIDVVQDVNTTTMAVSSVMGLGVERENPIESITDEQAKQGCKWNPIGNTTAIINGHVQSSSEDNTGVTYITNIESNVTVWTPYSVTYECPHNTEEQLCSLATVRDNGVICCSNLH